MLHIQKITLDGTDISSAAKESVRFRTTDTAHPVIGWAAVSDTAGGGQVLAAYSVTVTACGRTYWQTGWVAQGDSSVVYGGETLPVGVPVEVVVSVRNRAGEESGEAWASFVVGLLPENAHADWITDGRYTADDTAALYFRREFTVRHDLTTATLYCAGIGYQSVTVNGTALSDARLDPAHTDYTRLVAYTTDILTPMELSPGTNVLGIAVGMGWRGGVLPNGMIPAFFGRPMLWAILVLRYADGTVDTIATDERWQVGRGAITSATIYNGETYDARLAQPKWNALGGGAGFAMANRTDGPGGALVPMVIPPIRHIRDYAPVEITVPKPGMFVVDFGQNIAGVCRLVLPEGLRAGQTITIRHAEELNEDGTLYRDTLRGAAQTDTYIASGRENGAVYCPTFTYHGFRYCAVEGIDYLSRDDIAAELWCTDLRTASHFTCGSALVTKIHEMVVMTEMDNMHSILTDCPQRDERMGWMNDATVRFEETPYNFDVSRIFPKIVRDLRAEQSKADDGAITCTAPFIWGGRPADPVCSSYLVAGYETWLHRGNLSILAEAFDGFAAWEDCLLARSVDYIVDYSYYGDWAGPAYACLSDEAAQSAVTDGVLMSTGYSYYNCRLLTKMAELLGRTADAEKYREIGEKVRAAYLAKWLDPETGIVERGSQGAQAFSLWLGILPEEVREKAAAVLVSDLVARNYAITTGNLCTRYLFDALFTYGYTEEAWRVLTREEYPSYGFMLQNEATTVWERFELKKAPGMNSHNHPMYGAVGYVFYAYLCGIRPIEPGYQRVVIAPVFPRDLRSAHGVVDTVRGEISVRWSVRYGKRYLFVQLPVNVTAQVQFAGETHEVTGGYHVFEEAYEA